MARPVRAGLIQARLSESPDAPIERIKRSMIDKHVALIEEAGARGVQVLCMQELFYGPYFPAEQETKWYDRRSFLEFVLSIPTLVGVPFRLEYDLGDWRTTVQGDVAWTTLRNRAVLTPEGGDPVRLDWRETAVLRKVDGSWLLERYHSAPVR